MASGRCPVWLSKLSKLLNQEDALSAPCLRTDFCSAQAPSERGSAAHSLIRHILMSHFRFAPKSLRGQALMLFRRLAADARVDGVRCKAKQGCRGMTALTCGYLLTQ